MRYWQSGKRCNKLLYRGEAPDRAKSAGTIIGRFSKEHTISDVMCDFKRHTANQVVRQLMAENLTEKLGLLQSLNQDNRQEYKIWEDEYDARDIFSQEFLTQKMEYIHYNPCRPKWNLAGMPEEYPWSSARFYLTYN